MVRLGTINDLLLNLSDHVSVFSRQEGGNPGRRVVLLLLQGRMLLSD